MDTKKLFLYFALAIVAFSLWTAWHQDYPQKTQQTAETSATKSSSAVNSLPANKPQITTPTIKTPVARKINVTTDVLNLTIDTLGGNVVEAKLPQYSASLKHPEIPVKILQDDPENIYIAQSGLMGLENGKPLQYVTSAKSYKLGKDQKALTVNLTWKGKSGITIVKSFVLKPGKYDVDVSYQIENRGSKDFVGQYYEQFQRHEPKGAGGFFHLHTYDGAAISTPNTPYKKLSNSDLDKKNIDSTYHGGWIAMQQRYFLSSWIPDQEITHHYYSHVDNKLYTLGASTKIRVKAGAKQKYSSKLYIGPEIEKNLQPLAKGLERTIDYGWLWFISILIFWIMQHVYNFVGNWGWSIVIVTILIKLVFYKLSETSYMSMAKMRALAPKMKALKERYGDDKQKMSQATMELYKKEKVNPLGGCLPIVIQIPVFIGLYYVLLEAVQLRHAPFIFWIHDLSVKDPYYILPILMGGTMWLQQMLNPAPPDPTQAKMMMFLPIIFTVLFLSFPAGLVLYWLVNNVLSVLQQWHIMRRYEKSKIKANSRK